MIQFMFHIKSGQLLKNESVDQLKHRSFTVSSGQGSEEGFERAFKLSENK